MDIAPTRAVMRKQLHQEMIDSGPWCKGISIHRENLEKRAREISDTKVPNFQVLPSNIDKVYKDELLYILNDYEYFNKEKFDKLDSQCLMEDILFSLDLPKYKIDTPYFMANRYIESQPAEYSSSDVGDSDDEFENTEFSKFTLARPLSACDTSIRCKDGPIKGDMLIYNCYSIIFSQLNEWHKEWDDTITWEDSNGGKYEQLLQNDGSFLRNLGNYMFEQPACSEKEPLQKELGDTKVVEYPISFSNHNIKFKLIKAGITTRLINPKFRLLNFKVKANTEKGLTYNEINKINQKVLTFLSKELCYKHIDQELAKLQLARLKDTEHQTEEFENLVKNHYKLSPYYSDSLLIWIDYLNTLIFKVEASRINTTVFSGLMMLKLIEHGHLTYKEAFYDDESFLGQFPGASIATKHNLKTRAQLLTYKGFLGMKTDRQHPKWLMCTLKESITMMNWLKIFVLKNQDPTQLERVELLKDFTTEAHVMLQEYLLVMYEM
jgi:hypothetical protein